MSTWDTIDCVYIIGHPEYEKDRLQYVVHGLLRNGCPNEKIEIICYKWGTELTEKECFEVYDPWIERPYPCMNYKCRWLLKSEISLSLNFYKAVDEAIKKDHQTILVLESDVRFRYDFGERLGELMKKAVCDPTWSYISLSDGVGTHAEGVKFGDWYGEQQLCNPDEKQKYCPFRCTDSMIFRRPFLEFLHNSMLPFSFCLDWELNWQLIRFRGQAKWAEPHLIEQATQKRIAASSLRV
jgi:hypothetical protein